MGEYGVTEVINGLSTEKIPENKSNYNNNIKYIYSRIIHNGFFL